MRESFLAVILIASAVFTATSERGLMNDHNLENDPTEAYETRIENEEELLGGLIPSIKRPRPPRPIILFPSDSIYVTQVTHPTL